MNIRRTVAVTTVSVISSIAAVLAWVVLRLAQYFERLENDAAAAVAVSIGPELYELPGAVSDIVMIVENARENSA